MNLDDHVFILNVKLRVQFIAFFENVMWLCYLSVLQEYNISFVLYIAFYNIEYSRIT